jgi:molybdopterin-guanine dinucleotide biosynthesis protein A
MAPLVRDGVFVEDATGFEGPLGGVVGAARAVREPYLFVAGCDMPLLSAAAVRWLAGQAGRADAVAVVQDGVVQPTHALYRRAAVRQAAGRLPGNAGVWSLLDALGAVRRLPIAAARGDGVDLAASLTNVNTRAQLRALRAALATG